MKTPPLIRINNRSRGRIKSQSLKVVFFFFANIHIFFTTYPLFFYFCKRSYNFLTFRYLLNSAFRKGGMLSFLLSKQLPHKTFSSTSNPQNLGSFRFLITLFLLATEI